MTRRFGELAQALGHGYTLYGFGHFVATQLGAVTTTATIRERMGDGSLEVTGGYVHRVSEADREAARYMDALLQSDEQDPLRGLRLYQWAFLRLDHDGPAPCGQAGQHWLLVRSRTTGELACYRCYTPAPPRWPSWSRSPAGLESRGGFQAGKGLCGLDQHQVRRWRSWSRWATLACLPTPSWWSQLWPNAPATRHHPG